MSGITKQKSQQIQDAAAGLVASVGIGVIDTLAGDARKLQLAALARQLQAGTGVHYDTARSHIARALRRARGEIVAEKQRGGNRPGSGRRPDPQ